MKSAVTVSLVPEARQGPFVFHDDLRGACEAASRLGFDAIELFLPGSDAVPAAEVKTLLSDNGLSLAAVGTGAGWLVHKLTLTSSDATTRRRAADFVKGMIDYAAEFAAPAIIGSMQGSWDAETPKEMALSYLADAIAILGTHANLSGLPLLYEPLNRYETNLCVTLAQGAELIRRSGSSSVRLLADLFHMNIEEANLATALREHAAVVGHIHLADSNRLAAGMGHTNFKPVGAALRDSEYEGYVSAEVFPRPDPHSAVQQTIETYNACFRVTSR